MPQNNGNNGEQKSETCLACGHEHDWDYLAPINVSYCHRETGDGHHRCGCTEWVYEVAALRAEVERLTKERDAAIREIGPLAAEVERLRADAALGAGVRELVERYGKMRPLYLDGDMPDCIELHTDSIDADVAAAVAALKETQP